MLPELRRSWSCWITVGTMSAKLVLKIIVWSGIAFVAIAFAIPNLLLSSGYIPKNCPNQLALMDTVCKQWTIDTGATNGTVITMQDLETFLANVREHQAVTGCPEGGKYTLVAGQTPVCSIGGPGHTRR